MSKIQKNRASVDSSNGSRNKDFAASLRLGFLIHDVSRLRRVVVDRALKPIGLTRSQWWLLSFLGRRDGMTQSALAMDVDVTKVAIGGLIAMGHPLGPTGIGQVAEITLQLRGEAGARQQPGAQYGLAHMVGVGSVSYVHVLAK